MVDLCLDSNKKGVGNMAENKDVYCYKVPELLPEEKELPVSKFYTDYPLYKPNPLQQQILDAGPMDPSDAISVDRWLDLIKVKETPKVVYGYTMMPDGSGFYIEYSVTPPTWSGKWRRWYGNFYNHYSKSMTPEMGNLRYKIWNPLEHWDHHFVNGDNDKDGVWSLEMTEGTDPRSGIAAVSHNIDLKDYGLSPEFEKELEENDCRASACWEEFDGPGHHLVLRFSRPCPLGGRENINCEWLGYYAKDGKIIRDPETTVSEEILKKILIHNTCERAHLLQVLPDLYEEYKDKPLDAD